MESEQHHHHAGKPSHRVRDGMTCAADSDSSPPAWAERAAAQASELGDWVMESGARILTTKKSDVASELTKVAGAIRRAAEKLNDQDSAAVARHVETAAGRVERAASYLEQRDLNGVVEDVEALARRRPLWFLGGMLVAGIAAAQFVRAAASGPAAPPSNRGADEVGVEARKDVRARKNGSH